ncbi:MAG: acyl-CoA thioesterase [Lentisphaeria bacterium]|nr:acyl-CoA thioesterase [Lentisphaeria bacterium]
MNFHTSNYRVPYADTDQMGVVYYANYLVYFERSRTEMLRDCGLPYSVCEELGFFLPVVDVRCHYYAPAHYDELITFESAVVKMHGVKLTIASRVRCGEKLLVAGEVDLVCVNHQRRPVRIPTQMVEACQKYMIKNNDELRPYNDCK